MRRWGFLTTQALVVIYVTQHPHSTVREIAEAVGVTERATHSALADLKEVGILVAERNGRQNSYTISFEHLANFRREGTAPDLVPDTFVSALIDGLLPLQMPDYDQFDDDPHPIN
jgi:DNA-binding transcriptional ArsR family regulator